jgi:putative ABC transport system permease protein
VLLDTYDDGVSARVTSMIRDDPGIEAASIGSRMTLELEDHVVTAFGFESARGNVTPTITAGRRPTGSREVALGASTLRRLGLDIGDGVVARTPSGEPIRLRVVGRAIFPSLTLNRSAGLNDGAMVTAAALGDLDPAIRSSFFLVRTAPGVSVRELEERYHPQNIDVLGPQRPGEIRSYAGVRSTPAVLAGLLALLGVGVLAHVLTTSVRARRHELAVLKTIGFTRSQVATSVAWQASTLAIVPLLIGVPLGFLLGEWSWARLATNLGIDDARVIPVLAVAAVAVATVLLANAIAAFPARAAARTRPAVALRSE